MIEQIYGFPCVDNPHDFKPDEESCTPEEMSAHREACKQWDAGTYKRDPSQHSQWLPNGTEPDSEGKLIIHVTRTPWGIGTSTIDVDMEDPEECIHGLPIGDLCPTCDALFAIEPK